MAGRLQASMRDGRFDAFDLATRRGVIEGALEAATLPRVGPELAEPLENAGTVGFRIAGATDSFGRPALSVALSGLVPLTCQRCLGAFAYAVDHETLLLLASNERDLSRLDEDDHEHEVVLAAESLDAIALVEDELLLSLPIAPHHADGECPPESMVTTREGAGARVTAFDALAGVTPRKPNATN